MYLQDTRKFVITSCKTIVRVLLSEISVFTLKKALSLTVTLKRINVCLPVVVILPDALLHFTLYNLQSS